VIAAGGANLERCVHVDPDHVAPRRKPQLTLAGEQHLPGFMLLAADQGMLAVGAGPSVSSGLASGTGQAVVAAGAAVFGPPSGWKCQRQRALIMTWTPPADDIDVPAWACEPPNAGRRP
jgi:hypothetical protein